MPLNSEFRNLVQYGSPHGTKFGATARVYAEGESEDMIQLQQQVDGFCLSKNLIKLPQKLKRESKKVFL